jgi:enoyl-CoA hydratase/carnithine racemase
MEERGAMTKSYETLALEMREENLLLVTLNRPEVRNAINTQMGIDLLDLFEGLVPDPGAVRVVVVTGAGDKAFSAGGDLKERKGMTDAAWQAQHAIFERMTLALLDCPVPVIAAVNGAAYGGGTEIACAMDFAYASTTARFALTEVTLGIMPGGAGTQNLPRIAGPRRAKEIIFTGSPFTAQEAYDWGIVNKVCAPESLLEETLETASRIAANAPLSIRQAKKSIQFGLQMDLRTGMFFEIEAYNRLVGTEDRLEGVLAFNEKRKPDFKGR